MRQVVAERRDAFFRMDEASAIPDPASTSPSWLVVHVLARCEKKVREWATREGISSELPTYRTVHRYRGKVVHFDKVLFPGYLFLRASASLSQKISQHNQVARVLVPPDMEEFHRQISDILKAIDSGIDLRPVSGIQPGVLVAITGGPLRGMEGLVERREGPLDVVLRLDFIGQAASIRMAQVDVEVL